MSKIESRQFEASPKHNNNIGIGSALRKSTALVIASCIALAGLAEKTDSANTEDVEANNTSQQEWMFDGSKRPAGSITDFYLEPGVTSVINVTITDTNGAGYAQVLPGVPGATSNVNSSAARETVASLVHVEPYGDASRNSLAGVFNQVGAHVVVDRFGVLKAGAFRATEPRRVYDSRTNSPEPLAAGSVTEISGLEPNSHAALTITTTETRQGGYVQLLNNPNQVPGEYSNANAELGRNIGNSAVFNANADGKVWLYNQAPTEIAVDVTGYFAEGVLKEGVPVRRLLDTRDNGSQPRAAGSTVEVSGGLPNSVGIVRVTAVGATQEGYIQALPVMNPRIGSSSNLNVAPGKITGAEVYLEFGANGIGRFYVQPEVHLVVDLLVPVESGNYTPGVERLLDTRDGTQNRPDNKPCEKVAWAESSTPNGRLEDQQYRYGVYDAATGTQQYFPALGLTLETAGNDLEVDPNTCDNSLDVVYSTGVYPNARLYRRNLVTGNVSAVPMPPGFYERPEPLFGGLYAVQTDNGTYKYLNKIASDRDQIFEAGVRDFAISDNGSTKVRVERYFDSFITMLGYDRLYVNQHNPATNKQETYSYIVESPDSNTRINKVEVSPGGERVAVLRNNGSSNQELHEVTRNGNSALLRKIELPSRYILLNFRLADPNYAIVAAIDNSTGGPYLRVLNVDMRTGGVVVISTGAGGNFVDIAL